MKNITFLLAVALLALSSCKTLEPIDPQVQNDEVYTKVFNRLLVEPSSVPFDKLYESYLNSSYFLDNGNAFNSFVKLESDIYSGKVACESVNFISRLKTLPLSIRVHQLAADCAQRSNDSTAIEFHESFIDYLVLGYFKSNDAKNYYSAVNVTDFGEPTDLVQALGYEIVEYYIQPYASGSMFSYVLVANSEDTGEQRLFHFNLWDALDVLYLKAEEPVDMYSLEFLPFATFEELRETNSAFDLGTAKILWSQKNDLAAKRLLSSVKAGNSMAQQMLADKLLLGEKIEGYDTDDAIDQLISASEAGLATAFARLSVIFKHGINTDIDIKVAKQLEQKSVVLMGEELTLAEMALITVIYGLSEEERVEAFKRAASAGSGKSAFYLYNYFTDKNEEVKAQKYLELAANLDYAEALILKGSLLAMDDSAKWEDVEEEFFELLNQAKLQHHPKADFILSRYLQASDKTKSFQYLEQAAKKGLVVAQYDLAKAYDNGKIISQSFVDSNRWLNMAVKQGHLPAIVRLGYNYEKGIGVEKDLETAVEFYSLAAEQGHALGMFNYGYMLLKGRGVEKNYSLAVEWLEKAAENGHASANNELALMYKEGEYFEQNYKKANQLFLLAAEKGQMYAMYNLGMSYEEGLGVPKDIKTAMEWYLKAQAKGHSAAAIRRFNLLKGQSD